MLRKRSRAPPVAQPHSAWSLCRCRERALLRSPRQLQTSRSRTCHQVGERKARHSPPREAQAVFTANSAFFCRSRSTCASCTLPLGRRPHRRPVGEYSGRAAKLQAVAADRIIGGIGACEEQRRSVSSRTSFRPQTVAWTRTMATDRWKIARLWRPGRRVCRVNLSAPPPLVASTATTFINLVASHAVAAPGDGLKPPPSRHRRRWLAPSDALHLC